MKLAAALLVVLCASCAKDQYAHLYRAQPLAPGFTEAEVSGLQRLGATRTTGGVNFGVYSEHATRIELAIFDDPESRHPTRQFPMTRYGDVWNVYVEGVGVGTAYGYIAWGPNWDYVPTWKPGEIDGFVADVDAAGNRFNPNKLLFDPYSRGFTRDHDWSKGSIASGPKRTDVTYAAAAKSVVTESTYQWTDNETAWRAMRRSDTPPIGHRWQDLVVYEVHPKGFTADPASGVTHPGTFRGIGEKASYFKDLGITAVELMPVFEKPLDGGYWGYQTIGFFAPELSYSSDTRPGYPIDEFKWMVDQLHQQGVEVILDVVYNHTGEGGLWREKMNEDQTADPISDLGNFDPKEVAGLYSFRGLDNSAYYALQADRGFYWNNTGVGDETRCNHTPMQRLILDSLHYWATEMHIDGFRFDLGPILGEDDLNYNSWDPTHTVLQTIIDDPVLQESNTRIIAEPWSLYGAFVSQFPSSTTKGGYGWFEWNGRFRDWWRAFANYDGTTGTITCWDNNGHPYSCTAQSQYWKLSSEEGAGGNGGFLLTGSYDWYHWNQRKPYHSVNFVTVHDGFTMYDVFSYGVQLNGCGPLNPICCTSPASAFCDPTSGEGNNRCRNWEGNEDLKRQQMRNLFTAMLIAHGTPMLLGGDEWMRTQLGNNNAYTTSGDNAYNWFAWGQWIANDSRVRMHDFVRRLIQIRKDHAYAFAPAEYGGSAPFAWKTDQNTDATGTFWDGKHVALHYYDSTKGKQLFIMINMESHDVPFTLPTGVAWRRILDTQAFFEGTAQTSGNFDGQAITSSPYGVVAHSIAILEEAP